MSAKEQAAKEQAIQDIQQELEKDGKSFITYVQELDPIMVSLSRSFIKAQCSPGKSWCVSLWTIQ